MPPSLCVIEGDGIGREVVPVAVEVLQAALPELEVVPAEAGWDCFRSCGVALPRVTLEAIGRCGAALFGATASPGRAVGGYRSPILTLRQELDLYASIRPVRGWPSISQRAAVDLILVRENTQDLYAGRERERDAGETAIAERVITRRASRRIAEQALRLVERLRRRKLTVVHKANVLPLTDGLFRDTVREVAERWAGRGVHVQIEECYADLAALRMVAEPESFDVIVTTNLFGDILSDEAAHWAGGLGVAPSLNLGDDLAVAEPVHGAAPDIAGKGLANPVAAILSAALLAGHVWGRQDVAGRVEHAVASALAGGAHLDRHVTSSVRDAVLAALQRSSADEAVPRL